MKYAFSTIACPEFTWNEILTMAHDLGFQGIEVRVRGHELYSLRGNPFTRELLPATRAELERLHLEIPCLSSGCALKYADRTEATLAEITEIILLAEQLGVPYVRVLADEKAAPEGEVDDAVVVSSLRRIAPVAQEHGVVLVVETCGVYGDTARLSRVLAEVGSDSVAALWDGHHPYRFYGEKPETTIQNLGGYVRYVQLKDSVMTDSGLEYRFTGEGDVPIGEILSALRSVNFEGYITFEWIRLWAPDLTDAAVAIPHFIDYMTRSFADAGGRKLYKNRAGTGWYPWEKEHLIDLTFPQVLDRIVEEFPDQYAFRYTTCDYTRTYSQFRDDVDRFARSLIALGVRPGSHVAIWATNVPAWFITFWATVKIGAVLVTVNTAYKIHEAEYLLRQSDTHTLVMIDGFKDSDYVGIVNELCPELAKKAPHEPLHARRLPFLRNVITVDGPHPGCLTWQDAQALAEQVPPETVMARANAVGRNDVCNMQYTSGTTGFPKGVMLTHYNVVNNGKAIGDCMDLSTADRMMIQVPMFHCFGMVLAMTASMTHGVTMSPIPAFSPRLGLECINREKITCFHGVPTMFIAMMNHGDFPKTDFSHMRTGIMAGSPCPIKVMEEVVEKMHMPEICITFGQTEASPATTMSKTTDSLETRVNTVGSPIYAVECRIVDPETGEELPDNVDGEFVARGYNIMKGYYKMPAATAAAIDAQGWLHTGDLCRRLPDGNYKVTGRIKDMIIRGGENIYPKEIEDFLYTHPKISDVQVIGVPDEAYGEEIMACVVLRQGETATEEEIKDYVRTHMAKHKVPRYVAFVESFPMNAAGKILKYKMREQAVELLKLQKAAEIVTA